MKGRVFDEFCKYFMIFIGGIHGVGKSYLCVKINNHGFYTFSASKLISERKNFEFSDNKLIPDIEDNQRHLISAISDINKRHKKYILEGHFCLLNSIGEVTRVPKETFLSLTPRAIIILKECPSIIADRYKRRNHIESRISNIKVFQDQEITYAIEIAKALNISYLIANGKSDFFTIIEFIKATYGKEEI